MVTTRKYAISNMAEILENVRPFTVGFDTMFHNLETVSEIASNYPPYNIIKNDDEKFTIEIACAGFRKEEFNIHMVPTGNKLVVQGMQDRGEDKQDYYHKGIGARNFTRTFALAEDVEVTGSEFVDGMLNIFLIRNIPEEKKVKQIIVK
jgi:molecular chaperone IbpA